MWVLLRAMHIYIDESGDTGFKLKAGSSRCFVIALLLVDDPRMEGAISRGCVLAERLQRGPDRRV